MGSMSASDAAPLPRLGEVFFDVRGSSRSMRLSWYSDTGVAVFSIWQGGTCTGTFRLPIDDLPRMVEALQRGPRGAALPAAGSRDLPGGQRRGIAGAPADPALTTAGSLADYATGQYIPLTGEFRSPIPDDAAPGPAGSPAGDYAGAPGCGPLDLPAAPSYGEASHRDDPLGSGAYPAYGDRGQDGPGSFPGYADDGPPPYRDASPPSYRDGPLGGGYRDHPSGPLGPGGYRDDPLGSGAYPAYRDDDRGPHRPSYRDEPAPYPGEHPGQRYADGPFEPAYPDASRGPGGPGYPEDARASSHPYGPPPQQRAPRGRS